VSRSLRPRFQPAAAHRAALRLNSPRFILRFRLGQCAKLFGEFRPVEGRGERDDACRASDMPPRSLPSRSTDDRARRRLSN
jgi:hypothetical protein